ncbi:branched-chain amino acid ABC transporter permease [Massilia sp. B-10]|nr:branched-chain amino acid ABC transporter permease [Massilia sp. B-10]
MLNFGHGAFVSVGAYAATLVLIPMRGWLEADALLMNLAVLALAVTVAMVATALLGWAFERIIIAPVYGQHLKQILITMGGMIVAEQLINVIWGAEQIALPLPTSLRGAIVLGDAAIEKYRLVAVVVGLVVFAAMFLVLNRTKIGLLIRCQRREPRNGRSDGLPHPAPVRGRVRGRFHAGLGLGGVMWGLYKETLTAAMGGEIMVMVFIVIIIGGLGSVGGCFIGALLMALVANYASASWPPNSRWCRTSP